MKNKKGFTLAEVLITLGIIGVVAALTIPTLSQNATERSTVVATKKIFSILSSAYKRAEQEDGNPTQWDLTFAVDGSDMLNKIKPYLQIAKDCTDLSSGCWSTDRYKGLDSSLQMDYDGETTMRLVDGTLIFASVWDGDCALSIGNSLALQNICGQYLVDINGAKKPNQHGKDLFGFWLTKYGIVPAGSAQEAADTFDNNCRDKATQVGSSCAAWLIYNDNMDYLHCNDLSWAGKSKCN